MTHYPGHLRQAFLEPIVSGMPDTATVEVGYEPQDWSADKLLGRVCHCTDVMPADVRGELDMRPGSTYAAAAQRLLRERRSAAL